MNWKSVTAVLLAAVLTTPLIAAETEKAGKTMPQETNVFVSGIDGYHTYRVPSVIVTPRGTLLAFCEGRKGGRGDTGNIDLMLKRSSDGGKTWSKQQVVWDDEGNTCGNPCPVIDRDTGVIWLLLTWNRGDDHEGAIKKKTAKDTRRVFVCSSSDDGVTWSKPAEITKTAKKPDWRWYATGPGAGIQLTRGRHKGRLVIPCDHSTAGGYDSHIIYSDDHGRSWKTGGTITPKVNECEVIERTDGTLLINMRNDDRRKKARATATSTDGGATWSKVVHDETLIESICQASMRRYTTAADGGKDRILFSNPASTNRRVKMTVRLSYDEGRTWPVAKQIHAGGSAYSCLTVLPDRTIGLLYEKGGYKTITFACFTLGWLTDGEDSLKKTSR